MNSVNHSTHSNLWWIEPRDPLVFGDGAKAPALMPRHPWQLPPHSTFAGFVRSRFVGDKAILSDDEANDLLKIRIAGPWLARRRGEEHELWLPAPADVVLVEQDEEGKKSWRCLRPKTVRPTADAGVLWPEEVELWPVQLQQRAAAASEAEAVKTRFPAFPFFPFDDIVSWHLGELEKPPPEAEPERRDPPPIAHEGRVHVSIDPATHTALPEALFSSGGLRFAEGFGLLARIEYNPGEVPAPQLGGLGVLGAEARSVRCTQVSNAAFPSFEAYRGRFKKHLEGGRSFGLRLQLVTPGCFGGWLPPLPEGFPGRLQAVCLPRYVAVSGWNLKAQAQRPVRRLVAAGTVYTFGGFATACETLEWCEKLWGLVLGEDPLSRQSFSAGAHSTRSGRSSFLAPPTHDGYGQVLPIPYCLDEEKNR